MSFLAKNVLDIRHLDIMARQSSWVHAIDSRAKVLTTLVFVVAVVSVDKYALSQLLPFLLFPVILIVCGNLSPGFFLKKIALVAPFAFFLGIFNPLLDRDILFSIGGLGISGGWASFASLMLRFVLTVGAALILIAITGFNDICFALRRFGVPQIFINQLQFLYRYLFVLIDEAGRMYRARVLRTFSTKPPPLAIFSSMLGSLLLRAADRAERIYLAMRCRGYDGTVRSITSCRFRYRDALFIAGWLCFFLASRAYNIPQLLGSGVLAIFS